MHFCTAFVAIAEDDQQVMFRGLQSPISWPEIEVLRTIHGDNAVRQVKPFVQIEQSPRAEKERLGLIYGEIVSKEVFTGRTPNMEMDAPGDMEPSTLPPGTMWLNPLTHQQEEVNPAPVSDTATAMEAVSDGMSEANKARLSQLAKQRPRDDKGRLLPPQPELPLNAD